MARILGLALSGGGFRASLFHVGVLARLAELDLLRQIDVISTVSGGSILGAFYYLKVKQLLEGNRADHPNPNRQAYIDIVAEIEKEFLAVVQKNLRTRALWNPYKSAKMLLSDDYSRSDRMSELYNKHLYLPLWRGITGSSAARNVPLREIKILPPKMERGFDVRTYNLAAEYKVPILVINATTLNTGHSWHFTSSWVGEPAPRSHAKAIDTNVTLKQLRFDGTAREESAAGVRGTPFEDDRHTLARTKKLNELTLADAVASSAAVPGIFSPMPIHDLYWSGEGKEIVVELVDGGVFDNQGLDALYMEECTEIICSDASGQMEDERAPSSGALAVALRSKDVLEDRVRDDGFSILSEGDRWKFAFFHLREQFIQQPGYPAFQGPVDRPIDRATGTPGYVYRLSNLRTDLDSFSDVEAYSLMYDGYCLSNEGLGRSRIGTDGTLPVRGAVRDRWRFLEIAEVLDPNNTLAQARLLRHLKVGKEHLFKVFLLPDPTALALATGLAAIVLALIWRVSDLELSIPTTSVSVGTIASAIAIFAAVALLKSLESTTWMGDVLDRLRWIRREDRLKWLFVIVAVVASVGSAIAAIHVIVFDRLYLRSGKIRNIESRGSKSRETLTGVERECG